jgi:hypothetical protein
MEFVQRKLTAVDRYFEMNGRTITQRNGSPRAAARRPFPLPSI